MPLPDYIALLSSVEDSPVNHSPLPGNNEARRMTVTSGRKCLESYTNYTPLGCLVRMCLESSIWRSTRCVLTWKRKATKSNRLIFQLAPSMPRTKESELQLWLATPTASTSSNGRSERFKRGRTPNPQEFVQMWPTPCASETRQGLQIRREGKKGSQQSLSTVVRLWTTPTAADSQGTTGGNNSRSLRTDVGGQLNPTWVEWLMGFPLGWTDLNALETL